MRTISATMRWTQTIAGRCGVPRPSPGVARTAPVAEASGFADEEVLDVPGRPRVIHTPGHTAGNAALSLADCDVLIVGDTLATLSLSHGDSGPQLLPQFVNEDHDRALASLEKIEPV